MTAPDRVLFDNVRGQEFVYRHTKNPVEVDRLRFAAWTDPLSDYGRDGDHTGPRIPSGRGGTSGADCANGPDANTTW